jgi:hypothetical protein
MNKGFASIWENNLPHTKFQFGVSRAQQGQSGNAGQMNRRSCAIKSHANNPIHWQHCCVSGEEYPIALPSFICCGILFALEADSDERLVDTAYSVPDMVNEAGFSEVIVRFQTD